MTYPPQQGQPYPPQPGYPPQGYLPPPYPPMMVAPPPRKSHTGLILGIVGGVLGLVLIGVVSCAVLIGGAANAVNHQQRQAEHDVTIISCGTQQVLDSTAGTALVKITNSGSGKASYVVTVAFESESTNQQYDTAIATVDDLAPGQTTQVRADGLSDVQTPMKCVVTDVSRF